MRSAISFRSVTKYFFSNKVLDNLTLNINDGEFVALAGANGAGKSTLLNLAMGLDQHDSGEIFLFDKPLDEHLEAPRHSIGYVSESVKFHLPVSMRELLGVREEIADRWDAGRANRLVEQFCLDLSKRWREVSRGQKMQFAFTLALGACPDLLILDEITAVLDPAARAIVINEIKDFTQRGRTAILATNLVTEAQQHVDRIVILDKGKVQVDTSTREIGFGYKKIRFPEDENLDIGQLVGRNSDGTITRIVPSRLVPSDAVADRRVITAEEVFIFHTRKGA